ncbi:hypothetical protein HK098_007233 [Nowakowskiella sp. JEL0407]|nr:hypothetical protein HK098_007233 [Nowakowskiella sp. JEL0407]
MTGFLNIITLSVYDLCSQIPPGYYSTYKLISDALNSSPRAVGQALKVNPFAPNVPCHRVLSSNCTIGGFQGEWGTGEKIEKKKKLLKEEGLSFTEKDEVTRLDRDFKVRKLFTKFDIEKLK